MKFKVSKFKNTKPYIDKFIKHEYSYKIKCYIKKNKVAKCFLLKSVSTRYKIKGYFIEGVEVDEKFRRQGICGKMMKYVINFIKNNTSAKNIFIFSYEENILSMLCYKKIFTTKLTDNMKNFVNEYNEWKKQIEYDNIIEVMKKDPNEAIKLLQKYPYFYKKDTNLLILFYKNV